MTAVVAGSVCCCNIVPPVLCNACGQSNVSVPSALAAVVHVFNAAWSTPELQFVFATTFSIGPQNRCRWQAPTEQQQTVQNPSVGGYTVVTIKGIVILAPSASLGSWTTTPFVFDGFTLQNFTNDGTPAGTTIVPGMGNKSCAQPISPIGTYGIVGNIWTTVG